MNISTDRAKTLDQLLLHGTESLDISESQHQKAVDHYTAIGKWLSKEYTLLYPYGMQIFAQGSFALGTAVKPLGGDEFDIDLVALGNFPDEMPPSQVKLLVGTRLEENATYARMLEEKNRCWRLNYAGQFHLDIIPAKPKQYCPNGTILVPDKEMKCWKETNPKGYLKWFALKKIPLVHERRGILLDQASVEPCPQYETVREKVPLQIANQIMKRHRDINFVGNRRVAPISIIITTLSGKSYGGDVGILETLEGAAKNMEKFIEYYGSLPYVTNPTNEDENFADKWHIRPERQGAFHDWVDKLRSDLAAFRRSVGFQGAESSIRSIFGKRIAKESVSKYAELVEHQRSKGTLGISAGTATLGGKKITIPNNTFYGNLLS